MLKDNENDLVIENFESEENRITGTTRKNNRSVAFGSELEHNPESKRT